MLLVVIATILILVGMIGLQQRFLPPLNASVVILIRSGNVTVVKGKLRRPRAKEDLADVLRSFRIGRGLITISSDKHMWFSMGIPKAAHQRLRNTLLN